MNTDTKEGDVVKPVDHTREAVAGEVTVEQAEKLFNTNKNFLHKILNDSIEDSPFLPYLDVMDRGTYPAEVAAMLTATVPETGHTDCIDGERNRYVYQAKSRVIKSSPVNLSGIYPLKDSIITEFQGIQQVVNEALNTSARAELYRRAGVKAVVRDGVVPVHMITGGCNQIDVSTPSVKSDSGLTFEMVEGFAYFMRDTLMVKPLEKDAQKTIRLISGRETLEGMYKDITGHSQEDGCYDIDEVNPKDSGLSFDIDCQPMHANSVDGQYVFIEPEVVVKGEYGPVAQPNPEWADAEFTVSFLCGGGSFAREVPAPLKDNNGVQLMFDAKEQKIVAALHQAFRPLYPWFVMPIVHKRRK